MAGKFVMSIKDYSKETSRVAFWGVNQNAGNIAAQQTLQDTLYAAIDAVILGQIQTATDVAMETRVSSAPASDKAAQVELKWLVEAYDATLFTPVRFSIPTADTSFVVLNTDLMDITADEGLALKQAIEAYAKSIAGNAVVVTAIRLVGRNL